MTEADRAHKRKLRAFWVLALVIAPFVAYVTGWAIFESDWGQRSPGRAIIVGFLMWCAVLYWGPVHFNDRYKARGVASDTDALMRWGFERGWRDVTSLGVPFAARAGAPFVLTGPHTVVRAMRGNYRGRDVAVLQYRVWAREPGRGNSTDYTVTSVATDGDVPATSLVTKKFPPDVVYATFEQCMPLKLESDEFNRAYDLVTMDERSAHALFHPRTTARLLEPDATSRCITWDANAIWVASKGWNPDFGDFKARLELLSDLAEMVPSFVSVMNPRLDGSPPAYRELPNYVQRRWTRFERVVIGLFIAVVIVFPVQHFLNSQLDPDGAVRVGFIFAISSGVFLAIFMVAQRWRRRYDKRVWAEYVNQLRAERKPY